MNNMKCPLFVLDYSFISNFIKGNFLKDKLFKEILRRKNEGIPFIAITNLSAFKRAIYLCNENISSKNIKFIMELVTIYPSKADYKNYKEVDKEFKKFILIMSEGDLWD